MQRSKRSFENNGCPTLLTEQGKRLGETHAWKTLGGAVRLRSITNIYSLSLSHGV